MYRGTANTRLNPSEASQPSHGHNHPYTSHGNGMNGNKSSRFPPTIPSPPVPKPTANGSRLKNDNAAADENIMHMKKSAEIAAVFSGAKINQTTDILDPIHQHSRANNSYNNSKNRLRQSYHGGQQQRIVTEDNIGRNKNQSNTKNHPNHQNRKLHSVGPQEMFSEADMHSSLGYFP